MFGTYVKMKKLYSTKYILGKVSPFNNIDYWANKILGRRTEIV